MSVINQSSQRDASADILKGIAVLLMIQVHLTNLFAYYGYGDTVAGKIALFLGGPPVAPVFLAVMGYFAVKTTATLIHSIYRGIKLILLGLILNVGLNAHVLFKIFTGGWQMDPLAFIFGVDILPLAGTGVILIAIIRTRLPASPWPYLALTLVFTIPPFFNTVFDRSGPLAYLLAFTGGSYSWSYFPIFPWMAYPLLGCGYAILKDQDWFVAFWKRWRVTIVTIVLVVLSSTAFLIVPVTINLPGYYHHDTPVFLWITGFLIVWVWLLSQFKRFVGRAVPVRYFQWVGINVTIFYVIQWLIIGNIATAIYRTQHEWMLFVWFIGITGITSLLVYALNIWRKTRAHGRVPETK